MPLEIEDPDQPLVSDISPDSHPFCTYPAPPPRSQAQNFLQKLNAFLNIKQLLKQMDKVDIKNDKSDEESTKEKALNLALENNFVTELTSLVVIRPDEEPKISNLKQSNPQQSQSTGFSAFNRVAYSSFS